mmetsp:Transcript_18942/g.27300  ORF Transcript_18942/g.27300 Transcript_18942/m.27300 type:complete len:195 (+) Transcript_18942:237-821(+)
MQRSRRVKRTERRPNMYKKGLIRGYNLHKNFFCNYTANGTTKEGGRCAMVSKLSQLKTIKEELAAMSSIWDECSYNSLRSLIGEQDRVDKRKRGIIHPEDDGKLVSHEVANGFTKRHKLDVGAKPACKNASVKACKCPLMSYMWYLICYTLLATLQMNAYEDEVLDGIYVVLTDNGRVGVLVQQVFIMDVIVSY